MPEPTFAQSMVAKYQQLLLRHAGQKSIAIDGMNLSLDDLERKYQHWQKVAAQESRGGFIIPIDLSGVQK